LTILSSFYAFFIQNLQKTGLAPCQGFSPEAAWGKGIVLFAGRLCGRGAASDKH
jgi:hypothetical protein